MFTSSSTETAPQTPSRYGTWPRYNPPPLPPPLPPTTPISSLTHQLSLSFEESSQSLSSTSIIDESEEHTPTSSSSPVISTPFVFRQATYSIIPLASPTTPTLISHSSPVSMGHYPDTPSPPPSYGINGVMMSSGGIIGSAPGTATSCIRLIPNHQHDPFMAPPPPQPSFNTTSSKSSRPALRSTLSHNAVFPRRVMPLSTSTATNLPSVATHSSSSNPGPLTTTEPARPSTAGNVLNSSSQTQAYSTSSAELSSSAPSTNPMPIASHPHTIHDATGHPFATGLSSSAPSSHPQFSASTQHSTSSVPINSSSSNAAPAYTDDLSLQTSSYGSYDASFSSASSGGSPWTPGMAGSPHHASYPSFYPPQGYYDMYAGGKQLEPILQPGEMPAPRPPMSYAALIGEALLMAPAPHHLYVSEISESIKKRYAYYRQNPSKIYNGVRHQTSMCKAFVKLPRPFGDQSGGARKWAIRAGCESWFSGGGYHPPGSSPTLPASARSKTGGKAKGTARAKQLAVGVSSPPQEKVKGPYEGEPWSPGPSSGPAFDGSGRPFYPFAQPAPPYSLPPGYHYIPMPHQPHHPQLHGYPHGGPGMYMPMPYPYQAPPPPPSSSHTPSSLPSGLYDRAMETENSGGSSPEGQWQEESRNIHSGHGSEHGSHASWDDQKPQSPISIHGHLSPHNSPAPAR